MRDHACRCWSVVEVSGLFKAGVKQNIAEKGEVSMEKTVLQPDNVAKPAGTYSQGVKVAGKTLIFVAGQVSVNAKGELVGEGDMRLQVRQVHENVKAVLAAGGATFENVVKTTTFVTDVEEYRKHGDVRKEYLKGYLPPSTVVQISRLARPEFLIEMEAIAII
ncbi:MAG: RidA family protein [Chloroflexi bacterium]|nr:RidA family protein [Chloroflexota bacterium]